VRFRYSLTGRKSSWQKAREKGEALPSWLSIKKIGLVDRRGAVRRIEAHCSGCGSETVRGTAKLWDETRLSFIRSNSSNRSSPGQALFPPPRRGGGLRRGIERLERFERFERN
jgi:hypothetical protein